jgi:AcrR family transcriptional regulator
MTEHKRVYRSALRAEQAQRTRVAVLDAAGRCFLGRGYAATTMRDIAAEAGVAVQTVFAQGNKASLLLACVDRTLVGDDAAVPLLQRDTITRLFAAPDKEGKLRAFRDLAIERMADSVPMVRAFTSAAAVDAEIASAWEEYERRRLSDMGRLVGAFEPWLREGLDVDRATDEFWAVFGWDVADRFVRGRGWSPEEYADWFVTAIDRLLLRPAC